MSEKLFRLKKNKDFRRVYRSGRSLADKRLVLYLYKNSNDTSRIGFSVSKKVGKAVKRNKIRRILKEISRLNRSKIKSGYDLIVLARPSKVPGKEIYTYQEFEKSFLWLIKKGDLLVEEEKL